MRVFLMGMSLIFASMNLWAMDGARSSILSLNETVELARKNNPEILAARKKWEAMKSRTSSEKGYDKTGVFYQSMYSGRERSIGVSQDIPFPGKLHTKGKIAEKEALMEEEAYHAMENEVVAKVKSAYAELFFAHKSIEIFNQNTDLMRHFSKAAESKYSVGKASQVDVLKAQVELSKMLTMLVTLEQEKETAQVMLNILLNRNPEDPLGVPEEPRLANFNWSYQTLKETALVNRPELLQSTHHLHHSRILLRSAWLEYLPDFMAEYSQRKADNPEMDNTADFRIGVSVPLWFTKQKGMTDAARREKERSEAEFETMRNMTLWKVKELLVKVQTAQRLIQLYRTSVIPQAENALKVSESAYQSDRISFLDLVDIQRNLLQFKLEHYQHLADYETTLAELERAVGKSLTETTP